MALKMSDIILTLALNLIQCARSDDILSCGSVLDGCPGNQICNITLHQCSCEKGLVLVGEMCEVPTPADPSIHSATTSIVVIFTLVLIAAALVLVIKKYNIVEFIHQKINLRRNNDVMYEDVMIGNDDPPLNP